MLTLFMYPVSGVLKLWHALIHSFVPENTAWIISILLLVLTVRGLIAPLTWMSVLSARRAALMRPEKLELDERKKQASTVAEMKSLLVESRELTQKYNYNPLVGCLPSFVMIPAFLGLYRVIYWMAQPDADDSIGMLNKQEVESFRETELFNMPLPAYVSMPQDTAAYLGVSGDAVRSFITPLLIAALTCTLINMTVSLTRSYSTMQFDQAITRRMFYFMVGMTLLIPFMLWSAAMNGPVPVAVILYWFLSNLFTMVQTIVFEVLLRMRYPLTEEVHELRRQSRREFKENRKKPKPSREEKAAEKAKRKKRSQLQMLARRELAKEKKSRDTESSGTSDSIAVDDPPESETTGRHRLQDDDN